MKPYHEDPWLTVYQGDCREVMAAMEPGSVHCVVTSPPYWGLRDYGVDGALGLEATPEEFVANMVGVFREVRRVLRDDGTCWVNLGDSYATSVNGRANDDPARRLIDDRSFRANKPFDTAKASGLKPKDLVGIPWRVAFALQADGWYLRSDIIWSKPNPMPESVTDRPTKSHEYVFLLSKKATYWYDAEAVREPHKYPEDTERPRGHERGEGEFQVARLGYEQRILNPASRNLRSVWSIATQPYPGAHFATFPEKLVEPCIKAGCPDRVCSVCGAGWKRQTDIAYVPTRDVGKQHAEPMVKAGPASLANTGPQSMKYGRAEKRVETTGWSPSCAHDAPTVPGTVLDPFGGSGTTGRVAQRLNRRAVLIDLNGEYLVQAMGRNREIPLGLESA